MVSVRLVGAVVAMAAILGFAGSSYAAPPSTSGFPKLQRDGTISMAGRSLRCGSMRIVLDGARRAKAQQHGGAHHPIRG